ncbi:MAG TPA: GNAT family N-acetyltransferase [Geminicoccaceae bacterium]
MPKVPLTLETERLRLRQFGEGDLDDLARLNADPAFARFIGGIKRRSDSWRQLAMLIGHWQMRGYGWYAVTLKGDDRLIGRIGHWYPEGWPELEVGWALDPALWGRGYAVEGARACLEVARESLGLASVISLIDPSNRASQRVCEKLGGRPERPFLLDGTTVDIWRTPTG